MVKKTLIAAGLACTLALPFSLAGCSGGSDAPENKQAASEQAAEKEIVPGVVDMDHLKAGMKYMKETSVAQYADVAAQFDNEGKVYEESDGTYVTYRWATEDDANRVLVTLTVDSDGNPDKVSGRSWTGDEIKNYMKSLG